MRDWRQAGGGRRGWLQAGGGRRGGRLAGRKQEVQGVAGWLAGSRKYRGQPAVRQGAWGGRLNSREQGADFLNRSRRGKQGTERVVGGAVRVEKVVGGKGSDGRWLKGQGRGAGGVGEGR